MVGGSFLTLLRQKAAFYTVNNPLCPVISYIYCLFFPLGMVCVQLPPTCGLQSSSRRLKCDIRSSEMGVLHMNTQPEMLQSKPLIYLICTVSAPARCITDKYVNSCGLFS